MRLAEKQLVCIIRIIMSINVSHWTRRGADGVDRVCAYLMLSWVWHYYGCLGNRPAPRCSLTMHNAHICLGGDNTGPTSFHRRGLRLPRIGHLVTSSLKGSGELERVGWNKKDAPLLPRVVRCTYWRVSYFQLANARKPTLLTTVRTW